MWQRHAREIVTSASAEDLAVSSDLRVELLSPRSYSTPSSIASRTSHLSSTTMKFLGQNGTILVYLAIFAQLGVVTRVFLDKFFLMGCNGGWGPCLAGTQPPHLPPTPLLPLTASALPPSRRHLFQGPSFQHAGLLRDRPCRRLHRRGPGQ
jgi:hypothetical protein